ncbi:c-type cytochrome [Ancylobacter oerskovii]|uniref:C-type cytochrome n=1 Tax=Ancylobacter oerskovii TaxID=459519 RepID=A0ABW4Z262_9HYPH|nr:c-type cytochrome [Ancylobacter oerskovii]MBS7544736.1 c-type cytochrome [Ancylobacter oerskovii]
MRIVVTGRRLLLGLAVLGGAGLLLAWSGIVNIGASTGHWQITNWALHWGMRNYVRTYAWFEPEPPADLDAERLVRRAAGHFETGCAFCHGSPLMPTPVEARHMTPPPPRLTGSADKWTPRELSRIVGHGVKYTGMPAWPARGRADEVWAMVGFLRALPQMTPERYRALAFGPAVSGDPVLEACARCHGQDGGAAGGAFPVIGGQSETYLAATLRAFREGRRHGGFMQLAVERLTDEDVSRLARHYAERPGLSDSLPSGTGEAAGIARNGLPQADVPACESCHGASARRNPAIPRLAGQDAGYLAAQLRLMRQKARGGSAHAPIMQKIAERLPEDSLDPLAAFYAGTGR